MKRRYSTRWSGLLLLALGLALPATVGASPANEEESDASEASEATAKTDSDAQQTSEEGAAPTVPGGEQVAQASPAQGEEESSDSDSKKAATVTKQAGKGEEKKEEEGQSNAAVQSALGALAGGGTGLPFGAIIRLSNSVGYGTFITDSNNRRPLYDISLSLNPYVDVAAGHRLSAFMSVTKNIFSNGDGSGADLGEVSREGQTTVSDLIVGYTALNVVQEPVTGLRLNLGASVVLPTSLSSQYDTLLVGTRVQATILEIWEWFVFAYTFRVTKNFHEYTHGRLENSGATPICFTRGSPDASECFPGGLANVEWSFLNNLYFSFMITPEFSINLSWAMINSLSYDVDRDPAFVSENADSGRGQRDAMIGSLSLFYQINQYFAASVGATSVQAPFTPDNQDIRFPFFSTNANNVTVFDLTLTGTF